MHPHLTRLVTPERRRTHVAQAARRRAPASSRLVRRAPLAALTAVLAAATLPAAADAAVANVVGSTLQIQDGLQQNNTITLAQLADGRLRVTDTRGIPRGQGCVSDGSNAVVCAGANSVLASLAEGDDTFVTTASVPTQLAGGDGDDQYASGNAPGPLQVDFSGGAGRDRVNYAASSTGVTVTKDQAANDGRTGRGDRSNIRGDVEQLIGSPFGDTLTGSPGNANERFFGLAGDDVMTGGPGLDLFVMEARADGADRIFGGDGFDSVEYTQRTRAVTINLSDGGADDGEAGEGDELRQIEDARTGSGDDTLKAHPAATTGVSFQTGGGSDTITGTDAADTILAFAGGRDTIDARGGDDFLSTRDSEPDSLACGQGTDTINADAASLDVQAGCERQGIVGVLGLTPGASAAEAGRVSHLGVRWRHPRAWRQVARVTVLVRDGERRVGEIAIAPRAGRMTADGAVELVRRSSRLRREGTTVRADLGVRLDPSLAGQRLSLDVEAADLRGRRQLERSAGTIRVEE